MSQIMQLKFPHQKLLTIKFLKPTSQSTTKFLHKNQLNSKRSLFHKLRMLLLIIMLKQQVLHKINKNKPNNQQRKASNNKKLRPNKQR